MPEIPAASPDPACFCLHSESGIEENQSLAPDLFASRAPACGGRAHARNQARARGSWALRQGAFRQSAGPAARHPQSKAARHPASGLAGEPRGRAGGDPPQTLAVPLTRETGVAAGPADRPGRADRAPHRLGAHPGTGLARPRQGLAGGIARRNRARRGGADHAADRGPVARRAAPQSGRAGFQPAGRPSGSGVGAGGRGERG
jgi:hypothetical protein